VPLKDQPPRVKGRLAIRKALEEGERESDEIHSLENTIRRSAKERCHSPQKPFNPWPGLTNVKDIHD